MLFYDTEAVVSFSRLTACSRLFFHFKKIKLSAVRFISTFDFFFSFKSCKTPVSVSICGSRLLHHCHCDNYPKGFALGLY